MERPSLTRIATPPDRSDLPRSLDFHYNGYAVQDPEGQVDFRHLFESAPGLYLVLDPNLMIVGASDAYLRATMTQRSAIVGRNLYEIFPDNSESGEPTQGSIELAASLQRVLREHTPDPLPIQRYDIRLPAAEGGAFVTRYWSPLNLPILSPQGELLWILHCVEDVSSFAHALGGDAASAGLAPDSFALTRLARGFERHVEERTSQLAEAKQRLEAELANREQLELQFMQAQKMEAVGRLAGGVAHDFNNLLTVIQGFGEMLVAGESDPKRHHRLSQILRAAERAAGLTRQLLAFSRRQILQPRVLNPNSVVSDVSSMLTRLIGEDIELVANLVPDAGSFKADLGQLEQVLVNLAVNARDAMPKGGTLTLETANVELDESFGSRHGGAIMPGSYVMIAVTDTGIGMDKATLEKIFEPFFTTKDVHKGTGLGLSTVYGIVKQSGGNIWVYSEPGFGTCFKLYLPRVFATAAGDKLKPIPSRKLAGNETILLVEDLDEVREMLAMALQDQGYDVLLASGAAAARRLLQETQKTIHVLVTDLLLADGSGRDLADYVKRKLPGTGVLLMSGYTDDTVIRQGLDADTPFLQKPFRPLDLLAKIRSLLD